MTIADPTASLLLSLAIILVGAKLGGHLAASVRQPPVLGELVAGLILGNLTLAGFSGPDFLKSAPPGGTLAPLGVVLPSFPVGLESTVAEIAKPRRGSSLV